MRIGAMAAVVVTAMICGMAWAGDNQQPSGAAVGSTIALSAEAAAKPSLSSSVTSVASANSAAEAGRAPTKRPARFDFGPLLDETRKFTIHYDKVQSVVWMTQLLLTQAELNRGDLDQEATLKRLDVLKPYLVFFVNRKPIRSTDLNEQASEDEIKANAWLVAKDGSHVRPLDQIPAETAALLDPMQAVIKKSSPSMRVVTILFPNQDAKGRPLVDELVRDKLTVVLGVTNDYPEATFVYHTPLDGASPPMTCPGCKEQVSPKWGYCPWCGKALPAVK
jgi:hypothetical protein